MEESAAARTLSICRSVLAGMGEGVIFTDGEGRLVFINRAAEEIQGIRAENYLGRDLLEIHSHHTAARVGKLVQGLKDGTVLFSTRVIEIQGSFFEHSHYPIHNAAGEYVGALLVSRDITEKKRLLEENMSFRDQSPRVSGVEELDGGSHAMLPVIQAISAAGDTPLSSLFGARVETEKRMIQEALRAAGNRKGEAARLLNISRKCLWQKMKQLDIG